MSPESSAFYKFLNFWELCLKIPAHTTIPYKLRSAYKNNSKTAPVLSLMKRQVRKIHRSRIDLVCVRVCHCGGSYLGQNSRFELLPLSVSIFRNLTSTAFTLLPLASDKYSWMLSPRTITVFCLFDDFATREK